MGWERARAAALGWRTVVHKLRWGIRTVGLRTTATGLLRLLRLRVGGPRQAEVYLKSGAVMEFQVPGQLAPMLVVFAALIDPEFAFLQQVSQPDWVVVDAGAAIGQFTVFAAGLPVAVVHAFEPNPDNVTSLQRNVLRNGLEDRVELHRVALSDHEGEGAFGTPDNAYLGQLDEQAEVADTSQLVPVRTLAGEAAALGLGRISVLKVNVAGYEPEVLAGAAPLLSGGHVDILVLLIGRPSEPWYEKCREWGYDFYFFHPRERALHLLESLDTAALSSPPWPARHLIGVRRAAAEGGLLAGVRIVREDGQRHDG